MFPCAQMKSIIDRTGVICTRREIKDLGFVCNWRHVRHSQPGVGRWGEGAVGVEVFSLSLLWYIKLWLWKSMSGWQSYYRHHPLYVSAQGSERGTFITFPLIFMEDFIFTTCISMRDYGYAIKKEKKERYVWECHLLDARVGVSIFMMYLWNSDIKGRKKS